MDTRAIDAILAETLADGRLSRAERTALSQRLEELADGKADLDQVRARAFELVRTRGRGRAGQPALAWLEEVAKLLAKLQGSAPAIVGEARFSPGLDCLNRINHLFKSARRSVDVCVFTITDDRISREVLAAHERGVALRIATDDDKAWDPGSDISRFRDAGIPVAFDRSPAHMHHKFAIFDGGTLLTGSYNWTRSAAAENLENLVVLDHPPLVNRFSEEFERIWKKMESV